MSTSEREQQSAALASGKPNRKVLGLPTQQCACFSTLLVLISLGFMVGATATQDWSFFGTGEEKRVYGLMRCGDCPPGVAGTNWYCPLAIDCVDHPDGGLCDLADDMYNAGNAYLVGQLPTFMLGVMLLERLLYGSCKKDFGWPWVVYVLCGFYPVAMLVSIIMWFASNEATYEEDCEDRKVDWQSDISICASNGAQVAMVATILACIAGVTAAVVFSRRPPFSLPPANLSLRSRLLMLPVLCFQLAVISLYVAAPAHEEWVETDGHMGGLLKLKKWGPYYNVGYDCISEPRCALDSDLGSCATFRSLHQSSMIYLFLEVGAIYAGLQWLEVTCHFLVNRNFGVTAINSATPAISVGLHALGTVIWLTRTQARFETRCSARPAHASERWDVCGKTGPILAIVNVGVGCVAAGLFYCVYAMRYKQERK